MAVDLHPADEVFQAYRLHQHDGQGVGLLTGSASRAPDPERAAGALGRQQFGKHLLAQCQPGLRVAEEPRHVDEQAVEQPGEFLRLKLQVVAVFAQGGESVRVHPAADTPHQRRPLVTGEIESAGLLHHEEKLVELLVAVLD